ncbi:hypothetical protein [Enterocloster lavalensis]|uniref:hypothetical protein n=1 Tax=Enterocloster lavalensis TaxID=460384 RepID=UPI001D05FC48|nr:hypothetical protein [Enterocloster lavalensis]MCB6343635.1 hypothetical protein [Enterocloster lavalensis]
MAKALSTDILVVLKDWIKNNRFDATRLEVNPSTGHLIAHESGNLKFSLDEQGHLISEVF